MRKLSDKNTHKQLPVFNYASTLKKSNLKKIHTKT